jgi:exodeoxyribonuclease V alpha subunit
MGTHLTARLAWHDDGWNGHICRKPVENTYCVGCYSYPGQMIAERRDLAWEQAHAGQPIDTGEHISPCIYSANAFGLKRLTAYSDPPDFFKDGTQTRRWELPPASVCVWPYEVMYADDLRQSGGGFDHDARRERASEFFLELLKDKSLIFYYANYSNPMTEDDAQRYLLVGLSRIKNVGEELMYAGCSEQTRQRFGGGFVWDRTITSHYPDQGLRLPYHAYREQPELMAKFAISPENPRICKFGSKHVSDDDALGLVEQFLESVETLQQIGDTTEDWAARKSWLQNLIANCGKVAAFIRDCLLYWMYSNSVVPSRSSKPKSMRRVSNKHFELSSTCLKLNRKHFLDFNFPMMSSEVYLGLGGYEQLKSRSFSKTFCLVLA